MEGYPTLIAETNHEILCPLCPRETPRHGVRRENSNVASPRKCWVPRPEDVEMVDHELSVIGHVFGFNFSTYRT